MVLLLSSCNKGHYVYISATTPACDSTIVSNAKKMYQKICGVYSCDSIQITIWLYDDGTYAECNRWGWFGGYYKYDKPLINQDYYYIRTMERYPCGRDQVLNNFKYVYQYNNSTLCDRFFVFGRDGSLVNIKAFCYYDSLDNESFNNIVCNHNIIPSNTKYISISDLSVNSSGRVPVKKGYNIIFYLRPNFNSCNIRWNDTKGLFFVSDDGEIHYFKKRHLDAMLKIAPPISEKESCQNGTIISLDKNIIPHDLRLFQK